MTQTAEILKTPTSAAPESIEKCAELAQLVERFVDTKGEYDERIPGLHMSSLKAPISTPNCFYVLSVGMILKGSKRLLIGGKTYDYEAGSMLVTSIDLPTSYEIGAVSKDNPFVSLSLKLNPAILAELLAEDVSALKPGEPYGFDAAPEELIEDFERLLRLLDRPAQIAARAPLLIRDIHYLALTSAAGNSLRSLYAPGSTGHRIRQAVKWMRENFRETITIEQLAGIAHMSPATFHRQFKELTSFTPIQYQKRLRLYEAQQFLMRGDGDVNSAAFAVGYVSPQQVPRSFGAQWRHCGLFFPYVRIFCGRRLLFCFRRLRSLSLRFVSEVSHHCAPVDDQHQRKHCKALAGIAGHGVRRHDRRRTVKGIEKCRRTARNFGSMQCKGCQSLRIA